VISIRAPTSTTANTTSATTGEEAPKKKATDYSHVLDAVPAFDPSTHKVIGLRTILHKDGGFYVDGDDMMV
jgi:hypothetical protein